MNYSSLARSGVRNGLAAAAYILAVALFMTHAPKIEGEAPSALAALFFLLLFCISALVTGSFVLWQPLKLLTDGKKNEAGALLCITGATLVAVMLVIGAVLLLR